MWSCVTDVILSISAFAVLGRWLELQLRNIVHFRSRDVCPIIDDVSLPYRINSASEGTRLKAPDYEVY